MSQENADLVLRAYEAFNAGDWERFFALVDPDVEWETTGMFLEAGVYRGHEGIEKYLGGMRDEFIEFRVLPEAVVTVGDRVVADSHTFARGKRSGAEVEIRFTTVYEVRDGKLFRARNFVDRNDALEAAAGSGSDRD